MHNYFQKASNWGRYYRSFFYETPCMSEKYLLYAFWHEMHCASISFNIFNCIYWNLSTHYSSDVINWELSNISDTKSISSLSHLPTVRPAASSVGTAKNINNHKLWMLDVLLFTIECPYNQSGLSLNIT